MKTRLAKICPLLPFALILAFSDKINYGYFIYEHDEKKYERPKITDWRRSSLEYQFSDDRLKFIAYDLDEKSYCVYDDFFENADGTEERL